MRVSICPVAQMAELHRVKRWSRTLAAAFFTLFAAACSTIATRVAAPSPLPTLGAPQMIASELGELAVWYLPARESSATIVLWPSLYADHTMYASLVERWRGKYRLVLIDGPGHGASQHPGKTYSMEACAKALAAVLNTLKIERVAIVGTSWGGLVAGEFAIAYPERTSAIAMLNTPFFMREGGATFSERAITWMTGMIGNTNFFLNRVSGSFFLPQTIKEDGPEMRAFRHHVLNGDPTGFQLAVRSIFIERTALFPRMDQIAAPALVVAGTKDELYPVEQLKQAALKLKRGRLEMVETSHISIIDRPQETGDVVERFLIEVSAR